MKEMNDEELQQLAEQGSLINERLSLKDEQNVATYQTLFTQLRAEPAEGLPLSFAANVRRAVQQHAYRKSDLKFHLLLLFIFTAILSTAFGFLYFISPVATEQVLSISPKFKWSAGLAVLVFWSIQFGSQRLNNVS